MPIDAKTIGDLLDRYAAALELYAAQWSSSPQDCVQEAFVELARQSAEPKNGVAWLYRTVRNRALNELRSRRRRESHEKNAALHDANQVNDPVAAIEAGEEQDRLMKMLDRLSDDGRELIVLRIWSGLTWTQIGDLMGISSSSAHRHYESALKKMKTLLEVSCPTNIK